jgi:hypothetical protein
MVRNFHISGGKYKRLNWRDNINRGINFRND